MSKLAHSCDETMQEIERRMAIEDGVLLKCMVCGAENILDPPDCPRGCIGCDVVTVQPSGRREREPT